MATLVILSEKPRALLQHKKNQKLKIYKRLAITASLLLNAVLIYMLVKGH